MHLSLRGHRKPTTLQSSVNHEASSVKPWELIEDIHEQITFCVNPTTTVLILVHVNIKVKVLGISRSGEFDDTV